MSLTGHIDVFPLEEVLRLLARSYKSGCLRVDASDLHGRVFLSGGSLTFATVGTDEDMRRQLLASKVTSDEAVRAAEVGGRSLTDAPTETSSIGDFFREEVVESLYRIRKPGKGQFVFNVDVAPKYRSESTFDVELCISEADRRAAEWADIESVITGIEQPLRVVSEAPHNEPVTLAPNTWKLVASFEGVSSVRAMSDRLGNSRFRVAKDLAALVRGGLVETFSTEQPTRYEMPRGMGASAEPAHQADTVEESIDYEPSADVAPEAEAETAADYNRSWWSEAVEAADEPAAVEPAAEADAPVTEEEPKEPKEEDSSGESFLDKVFSQLNENPEGQGVPSPVATQGFLKRRRMSSVGLDE